MQYSLPFGIKVLQRCCPNCLTVGKELRYKIAILVLTFIAYGSYHLSRRPLSVVKNILNRNCSAIHPAPGFIVTNETQKTWCDWEPFDSNSVLGFMDSCFLFSYAIFMFVSGFIAERCHLRYFLALGMIGSGIFTYLFGIAYYYDIHSIYYFAFVQIVCGAFQTTGWPAVVAAVGHWFGPHSSRGLIFGIWNSHTSFGNILGAWVSGIFVDENWGLSFIVPGIIVAVAGFLLFLFLVPYPEEVGLKSADGESESSGGEQKTKVNQVCINFCCVGAVSFMSALKVPGVIEFSLSLFFSKLVAYTFLYWLPKYIQETTSLSSEDSAYLSIPFDMGGIVGSILAGLVADKTGASGLTCISMLLLSIPALLVYQFYGAISLGMNIFLLSILGGLVNGPYCLITTAVAADLGNEVKDSKAMATVTAIIDGTGSIGAAVGPLLAGVVSGAGWNNVFYMVLAADVASMLLLLRIGKNELNKLRIARFRSQNSV
ncbi:sugar phosphate exchanger 2-like isoform X2 [Leptotrombidium deliense]|uniref:Sugar phosphate exchanger 3 n=1 Tax=Leptotrombidium deliense TaxID=299467 RepID=A0A443SDT3_9ACAR|nr:sugar phosphate exchanger 2-like isoform X2 [Leptotrombidium deliense]